MIVGKVKHLLLLCCGYKHMVYRPYSFLWKMLRVAKRVWDLKEIHLVEKLLYLRFRVDISFSNPLPIGFFQP